MNIFILKAMRYLDKPELFTEDEMKKNASDAVDVYTAAVACSATYAVDDVDYDVDYANHWIDKYFKKTGEDKQDYINEVERLR